ncbi:MAG: hypothetical protein PHS47_01950 [Methanocellales archaeon]|nr:hypothetical protein [Methanocellales archaeon]
MVGIEKRKVLGNFSKYPKYVDAERRIIGPTSVIEGTQSFCCGGMPGCKCVDIYVIAFGRKK